MGAAAIPADSEEAIAAVRAALKGPVLKTLRAIEPALAVLPEGSHYERTMGSIFLLDRCFQAFRAGREHFAHILVDPAGRKVADDSTPLSCGRTVAQVVAMVVRTAAKRYFREHLDVGREADPRRAAPTRAEALYHSIKTHLLFDWQVPLVPDYARLQPSDVDRLGVRILECTDATTLARAVLGAEPAADAAPPVAVPQPAAPELDPLRRALILDITTADGLRLKSASFINVLHQADVRAVLKRPEFAAHPSGVLGSVGAAAGAALVGTLGLRRDQLVVLLLAAYHLIGGQAFLRVFGQGADPQLIERLIAQARQSGIGAHSPLQDVSAFVTKVFARVGGSLT